MRRVSFDSLRSLMALLSFFLAGFCSEWLLLAPLARKTFSFAGVKLGQIRAWRR
jgi:hypothetical protein